jgi:hypothetical protein
MLKTRNVMYVPTLAGGGAKMIYGLRPSRVTIRDPRAPMAVGPEDG